MKVAIGSKNPVKVRAVESVFHEMGADVVAIEACSQVKSQPLSHEETRTGAINRAKDCFRKEKVHLGIGLEGGVFQSEGELYLCNWGALTDEQQLFVVSGPTLKLPQELIPELTSGKELNDIMHASMGIENLGSKQGAIGYYTKGMITRDQVFQQMVQILWGQYLFYSQRPVSSR
jgi:inosine/xanthosine triphosphatase